MIINSILSLAFLWSCRKCLLQLKEIGLLRDKIIQTQALPVSEAIKKISDLPSGRKIFMIVRGSFILTKDLSG